MYQFTSESVSEGHPDKVADLISDRVADYILNGFIGNRAAVETLVTTNMVTLAGEYKSDREIDKAEIENIVRSTIKEIGYDQDGFNWQTVKVYNELHGQSADIALGTDDFGAGDQGIMFGYACRDTEELMPLPIYYSHKILKTLSDKRRTVYAGKILPDSKCQITVNYTYDNKPADIATILVSTQHTAETSQDEVKQIVMEVIKEVVPENLLTENTKFLINPTGRFVIGGPNGDTGLTGRKIIVDTYGGAAPHGGGAFSGKDGTKVDRSAAYMARWLAKNLLNRNPDLNSCLVQLSYAIGVKQPMSILIYGDGQVREDLIHEVRKDQDLSPLGIINKFGIGVEYKLSNTTNYGHVGREGLPWEMLNY